jgi:ATP-dependent protease HslVU (ClpYQ) peptidase subunit
MTTIVATVEIMASDRRVTGGPMFKATKIQRIKGSIYGGAGNLEQIIKMFEWFRNPDMKPDWKFQPEFEILQLSPEGLFVWGCEMIAVPVGMPYYAIGSGSHYALGALECGAPPADAIRVAHKFDPYTGREVQIHKLQS